MQTTHIANITIDGTADLDKMGTKDVNITGGILTSGTRTVDDAGKVTFNDAGTLNYSGKLTTQDLKDHSDTEQRGMNLNVSVSTTKDKADKTVVGGSTSIGVTHTGRETESTVKATLGKGSVAQAENMTINRDVNDTIEVTRDQMTGALNSNITVDNRLFSEKGRKQMAQEQEDLYGYIKAGVEIATDVVSGVAKGYKLAKAFDALDPIQEQEVLDYLQADMSADSTQQAILPVVAGATIVLWLVDKGTNAWDAYQISKAIDEGRYDDARNIALTAGAGFAIGAIIPGAATAIKIVKTTAKYADEVVDAARGIENVAHVTSEIAPTTKGIAQYGPMTEKGPLPQWMIDSFRSGTYAETVTTQPTTLYRVYGGAADQSGAYWTTIPPTGPTQSIIDSALNPAWGNTATKVVKIEVPPGVKLYQGQAAQQGGLVGGGNQVLFPKDVKIDSSWIKP